MNAINDSNDDIEAEIAMFTQKLRLASETIERVPKILSELEHLRSEVRARKHSRIVAAFGLETAKTIEHDKNRLMEFIEIGTDLEKWAALSAYSDSFECDTQFLAHTSKILQSTTSDAVKCKALSTIGKMAYATRDSMVTRMLIAEVLSESASIAIKKTAYISVLLVHGCGLRSIALPSQFVFPADVDWDLLGEIAASVGVSLGEAPSGNP
ncbi:MAG: hypothetical protein SFX72_12470 [Isosphaeraceae bacterium]|nr:hypothetical protein [Isosphaeraceae bacterium]